MVGISSIRFNLSGSMQSESKRLVSSSLSKSKFEINEIIMHGNCC